MGIFLLFTCHSTSTFATLCRANKNAVPRGHEGAVPAAAGAGGGEPGATLQQRRRRPGTEGPRQLPQEVSRNFIRKCFEVLDVLF
jgi:hypothetical protein